MATSGDGDLIVGDYSYVISIYNKSEDYKCVYKFNTEHLSIISNIVVFPNSHLLSAAWDSKISIWEWDGGQYIRIRILGEHVHWINSIVKLREGGFASLAYDGVICI
jgi:hypothetical protein